MDTSFGQWNADERKGSSSKVATMANATQRKEHTR